MGPTVTVHTYYSWQGFHSVMLQNVMDHQGTFTNISTGWAGSAHDACIFHNTALLALVDSGCFMPRVSDIQLGKVTVLPLLIGDPAYSLLSLLMWPCTGQLNPSQAHFNSFWGWTHALVQCTFSHLEGH